MARHSISVITLACLASMQAAAQEPSAGVTQSITITGRSSLLNTAGVAGFGDVPLSKSPYSGSVINLRQLQDAGITSLADITRLDATTTDAYNAPGYWGQLAVRGYILDPRYNYRRDGLPINAETVLPAGNKQALEVLKGVTGLQAGTSSPGGLVNLVVKRPQADITSAQTSATDSGNAAVAIDLGRRSEIGLAWRINAEGEHLEPALRNAKGTRQLLALAVESRVGAAGLLEAELERSRQSQPSMPGFSLLGGRLPPASSIDPRTNLNNQPWSLPVVFDGTTGSLRYTHALSSDWTVVAHTMQQRLGNEDRVAFPYGCSSENDYTRYCSDGSFDLYDYRSEGERRHSTALDLSASGRLRAAGLTQHVSVGVLSTRQTIRLGRQAYNWVGTGTIDGLSSTPSDPALTDENTNRSERSTEWRFQDRVELRSGTSLWLGLRHSSIHRDSVRTDGSRSTQYAQRFTTPWAGVSHDIAPGLMAYVNAGQGIESEVAPNRSRYTNAGVPLPTLKSRQFELGLKQRQGSLTWNLAAFDIDRPLWSDIGACNVARTCTRQHNGSQRHRGIEADAEWSAGPVSLRGSAMLLRARVEGPLNGAQQGLEPPNVPARTLKLQAAYNLVAVPGLSLLAFTTHEGARMVDPENTVSTPGWTRLDLGARYATKVAGIATTWRLGVDNATDQRAWKEAPYQFGHAYLYPLPARQWHASVHLSL